MGAFLLIHISTLLLSIYPHFVEMMWITPFFGLFFIHKYAKNRLFFTLFR